VLALRAPAAVRAAGHRVVRRRAGRRLRSARVELVLRGHGAGRILVGWCPSGRGHGPPGIGGRAVVRGHTGGQRGNRRVQPDPETVAQPSRLAAAEFRADAGLDRVHDVQFCRPSS